MVSYYDKSIIIMKIVNDNGAIMFDNGYYTRVGANNDPEPVSAPEMPAFFAKFAKNNLSGLAEEEKQLYRNVFHSFAAMRIIFGKGKGK